MAKKSLLSIIIIILCFVAVSAAFVGCNKDDKSADSTPTLTPTDSSYFTFTLNETRDGCYIAKGNKILPKNIVLPSEHEGYPVVGISGSGFYQCIDIESVYIPDSIVDIKQGAFAYCSYLVSVTLPNTIDIINDYTFLGCERLKSITIPDKVTSIGEAAFYQCYNLESVMLPQNLEHIKGSAFTSCNIKEIALPDSLKQINSAFASCGLKSIVLPKNIESLDGYAFERCYDLEEITFLNPDIDIEFEIEVLSSHWRYCDQWLLNAICKIFADEIQSYHDNPALNTVDLIIPLDLDSIDYDKWYEQSGSSDVSKDEFCAEWQSIIQDLIYYGKSNIFQITFVSHVFDECTNIKKIYRSKDAYMWHSIFAHSPQAEIIYI